MEYFIEAPSRASFQASASRSLNEAYRRAKRKKGRLDVIWRHSLTVIRSGAYSQRREIYNIETGP